MLNDEVYPWREPAVRTSKTEDNQGGWVFGNFQLALGNVIFPLAF